MIHIVYNFLKSINFTIVILLLAALMVGCTTTEPQPIVIVKTKYKLVEIPNELLNKCSVSAPPSKDLYINSNYMKKEELLTNYILRLLTDIDTCNIKLLSIKKLQDKQKNIYVEKSEVIK